MRLSKRRGEEIKRYILESMGHFRDSVERGTWEIGADGVEDGSVGDLSGRKMMDESIVRVTEIS